MVAAENDYSWWWNALDGKPAPIDANAPEPGHYRVWREKGTQLVPIAYWYKNGELHCHLNGGNLDSEHALYLWPFASKNPITKEVYDARIETGVWPGESEAVRRDNRAPADDSIEAVRDRIEDLAREAAKLIEAGAATTEDDCNRAADLSNTLSELENKADELRVVEKTPHRAAAEAVDKKWTPLRDKAAKLKSALKTTVITPFLIKQRDTNAGRTTAGLVKRTTALRTTYRAVVEDRAALLDAVKDHPDLIATLQIIANNAAQKKIVLPGCRLITEQRAA